MSWTLAFSRKQRVANANVQPLSHFLLSVGPQHMEWGHPPRAGVLSSVNQSMGMTHSMPEAGFAGILGLIKLTIEIKHHTSVQNPGWFFLPLLSSFSFLPFFLLFWDTVLCIQGWPQTCSVAEGSLVLLILLPVPPKCWYHRCMALNLAISPSKTTPSSLQDLIWSCVCISTYLLSLLSLEI